MFRNKYRIITSAAVLTLVLAGCTSSAPPRPVSVSPTVPMAESPAVEPKQAAVKPVVPAPAVPKEDINLAQKSQAFHSGMDAGCSTAKGKYTKDSAQFNSGTDYSEGWFYGRRKCQPHKAG